MNIEIINKNVEYPLYGNIDKDICVKRLLWDESEEINFYSSILPVVENYIRGRKMFIFAQRACNYPIPFRYEKFGMWDDIRKKYGATFINPVEKKQDLDKCCTFYGICEIEQCQIEDTLNSLSSSFWADFVIFSDSDYIFIEKIEAFLDCTKFCVNMAKVINICCKEDNIIMTNIHGSNGRSINVFYIK